jgi:hypothetical protein
MSAPGVAEYRKPIRKKRMESLIFLLYINILEDINSNVCVLG